MAKADSGRSAAPILKYLQSLSVYIVVCAEGRSRLESPSPRSALLHSSSFTRRPQFRSRFSRAFRNPAQHRSSALCVTDEAAAGRHLATVCSITIRTQGSEGA